MLKLLKVYSLKEYIVIFRQLNPVLKDPYYLETQHLLIAVKGEDQQESYGIQFFCFFLFFVFVDYLNTHTNFDKSLNSKLSLTE